MLPSTLRAAVKNTGKLVLLNGLLILVPMVWAFHVANQPKPRKSDLDDALGVLGALAMLVGFFLTGIVLLVCGLIGRRNARKKRTVGPLVCLTISYSITFGYYYMTFIN